MELSKMTCHYVKCEDDTPTTTSTQYIPWGKITRVASRVDPIISITVRHIIYIKGLKTKVGGQIWKKKKTGKSLI